MTFDKEGKFYVQKRAPKNMSNVCKFDRVYEHLCTRLANLYVWGLNGVPRIGSEQTT
jgi:hypothetical protein